MSRPQDYLYDLLPYVYRARDAEQGYALRALLRVINEQVNVVESDIRQLYDNWFIETCEDWVVPYLGDLVGYLPVHEAGEAGSVETPSSRLRNRILIPRREVANTINFRRRKGTLPLLEVLANGVAGWPARAVEFYTLLGWTQHLNHQRPGRGRTADLRMGDALDRVDSPFDDSARTADVRRIISHRSRGRYDIPSVGTFVWRLKSYSVTQTPACCVEKEGSQCYAFSVLGNDTPLYGRPEREPDSTHIAEEIHVAAPIRRRAFERRISTRPLVSEASPSYYGAGKSLSLSVLDWPTRGKKGAVLSDSVIPADLSDWQGYRAPKNKVLVDPVRGRIVFPTGQLPRSVWVSYHYGFSADMGGGEYERTVSEPGGARLYRVRKHDTRPGEFKTIAAAYTQWQGDKQVIDPQTGKTPRAAVVEIADSGLFEEQLAVDLEDGESLQLRAANHTRPILRLLDYRTNQPDPFTVRGKDRSRFTLDGLLIAGRGIEVAGPEIQSDPEAEGDASGPVAPVIGDLCDVTIRHCTLVPGWDLDCDCNPQRPEEPSITLRYTRARLHIEHSIVGAIWVIADERRSDPVGIAISDSIIDATHDDGLALCSEDGHLAFATLSIARSTVIGEMGAHAVELAENSIFMSPLRVARRQIGCVRFCYVAPGSRTPRRYRCQPDLAERSIGDDLRAEAARANQGPDLVAIAAAQESERVRVRPRFNSLRYGTPTYGQLAHACSEEITLGADDESEMGAFHDLYQPQRSANLRARLEEFTPAGMDAGIIYAS